jgi:hypothetical protein
VQPAPEPVPGGVPLPVPEGGLGPTAVVVVQSELVGAGGATEVVGVGGAGVDTGGVGRTAVEVLQSQSVSFGCG